MFLGGRGGGAATGTAETSSAQILKEKKLKAERRQLTSCWETPAQLRLGARSRISPNVRANDCGRQRKDKGHTCHPPPSVARSCRPIFRQQTVISGVSGLRRQAEEGRNVLQHVAEKHRFRFNPGLKSPAAASPSWHLEQ